jgi:hypothetical protein
VRHPAATAGLTFAPPGNRSGPLRRRCSTAPGGQCNAPPPAGRGRGRRSGYRAGRTTRRRGCG